MTTHTAAQPTAPEAFVPDDIEVRDATHFRRIIAATEAVEQAKAQLREAVREARKAGDSWTVIGAALGVSKQAAQQRFAA